MSFLQTQTENTVWVLITDLGSSKVTTYKATASWMPSCKAWPLGEKQIEMGK